MPKIVAGLLLSLGMLSNAYAQAIATATRLSVPVPSVAVGEPTLLVATVKDASNHAVLLGTVTFYDGSRPLGSAQIVSGAGGSFTQGTAHLKTASFSQGTNSITAVFAGTNTDLPSTSAAKTVTVTVTGKSATAIWTALTPSVSQGQYTLSALLGAFGAGVPTGSVDFLDTTAGTSLGTIPLSGTSFTRGFAPVATPGVTTDPLGIATGDFNGDGFLDVAIGDAIGTVNYIRILLGKGDGTFVAGPLAGPFDNPAFGIVAGDFKADGKVDLAFDDLAGNVEVLLGNSDGSFQPPILSGSVSRGASLAIGDFNRDGKLDVADLANFGSGLGVLIGNGDGSFQPVQTYATETNYGVLVGDLNGDEFEDLVVNNGAQELLNKGDGTFNPAVTLPSECELPPARCLAGAALIDMNGDGKLDLVQTLSVNKVVTVSLGNGDGSFQAPQVYPFPSEGGGSLFIEDFNQDGKPDVVLAGGSFFVVYLNDGLGNLLSPQLLEDLVGGGSVQGDFNGDGLTDLFGMPGYNLQPGAIFLLGQTAKVQLNDVVLPASGAFLEASYSGDEAFAKSISNLVQLTGTSLDFAGGFAGSGSTLQLNGGVSLVGAVLQLTNGGFNEAGSAFTKVPVNTQSFTTDFTFQILNPAADGFTFAIQNAGPDAVGGSGSGLGYFGIPKSVAIKFDLHNNAGEGPDSTGLYVDGTRPTVPAFDLRGTGIDLHSGDAFHAHITYDGVNLTMTLTDTATAASWSYFWPIDLPSTVGGSSAYVGFTGATGASTATATIASWTYLAGPPAINYPAGFQPTGLSLNGSTVLNDAKLQLTEGGVNEAGSTFYTTPQNTQSFTTDFTFQILNPAADGFTFTIQNDKPGALGSVGSGLGYFGIPKSVAIKFDLHNNAGEGPDSTGLYVDGTRPTVPAFDLRGTGIDLHSGDAFHAHITYDGVNLTMTLTDAVTTATSSHSWPIDIPSAVGGNAAWVGFTGATGAETSVQEILKWTFVHF